MPPCVILCRFLGAPIAGLLSYELEQASDLVHVLARVIGEVHRLSQPAALRAIEALRGGDATVNAGIARDTLVGRTGPVRDAVLLNAAAAIAAYRGVGGSLDDAIAAGLVDAAAAIDAAGAERVLARWAETTTRLGAAG